MMRFLWPTLMLSLILAMNSTATIEAYEAKRVRLRGLPTRVGSQESRRRSLPSGGKLEVSLA